MDAFFDKLAHQLSSNGAITGDQLKLVVSILSSYFFAYAYRYLPANGSTSRIASIRHMYSISIALYTTLIFLKLYTGFLHISLTSLITFLLIKHNHTSIAPWINFAVVMMSMSLCHLDRQRKGNSGDTTLDYSGMMMIATIKLTMFGFNVQDGRVAMQQGGKKKDLPLTSYNQQMKITKFPTLLEFSGWMFFFGGFLVGPACEYMDYLRFTSQQHLQRKQGGIPSSVKPTIMILVKSALSIGILLSCSAKYNVPLMLKPEWQAGSFAKKLLFIQITAFVARCKYYTVWLLSEGACVLCGFGFTGYDERTGEPRWDRVTNINVVHCELPQSLKEMSDNWNMGANRWLKHYVYLRVTPPDKKAGAASTLMTYGVSALWHGFYPGYYIMFLSLGLFQTIGRMARKTIRPFMLSTTGQPLPIQKTIYDFLGIIATMFIINTMSMSFVGLYLDPVFQIWRQIYFVQFSLGAAAWAGLKLAKKPLMRAQKQRGGPPIRQTVEPKAAEMDVTDLGGIEPPLPESTSSKAGLVDEKK